MYCGVDTLENLMRPRFAWLFALFIASPVNAQQPYAIPQNPAKDCIEKLIREPYAFSEIRYKLAIGAVSSQTIGMLSDEAKPTYVDKSQIAIWYKKRKACSDQDIQWHNKYAPPATLV